MDKDLDEAKATGEESYAADAVTPAGGAPKKRKADLFKTDETGKADDIEKNVKTPQGTNNAGLHEMLSTMFGSELSEDFTSKATTIFEAALHERVESVRAELEEEFQLALDEEVATVVEELSDKLDSYLDYVIEQWMAENEVALETGYKVHVAESILASVKAIAEDHNLDFTEADQSAIEEMEEHVASVNDKYNTLVEEVLALREEKEELQKNFAIAALSEGMVATDVDRFKVLSEGISYSDMDDFITKLETIKESYFTESVTRGADQAEMLEEETVDVVQTASNPAVSRYVESLNRYAKS